MAGRGTTATRCRPRSPASSTTTSNAIDSAESPDDVQSALDDAASSVEEIAEREARRCIEHRGRLRSPDRRSPRSWSRWPTTCEGWAEEIKSADIPDLPEPEPTSKWYVNGPDAQSLNEDGFEDEDDARSALEQHLDANEDESEDDWDIEEVEEDSDEVSEEQLDEWRDEVRDNVTIVAECPV